MKLPSSLISQFVKITNDKTKTNTETTVYGTTVDRDGVIWVRLDGSDLLTPVSTTADVKPNERVTVLIKNHNAIITGNISSPAARVGDVDEVRNTIINSSGGATATNFIDYTVEDGVILGNKMKGEWQGYRTQLASDSSYILDQNGNIVAKYGANEVQLGKLDKNSIIKFCKNGEIKYDETTDRMVFSADALALRAVEQAWLHAENITGSAEKKAYVSSSANGNNPVSFMSAEVYDESIGLNKGSSLNVYADGVVAESDDHIRLVAPFTNVEGDLNVTGDIYDNKNMPIRNGLAAYTGGGTGGIDPDTTLESLVLTSHTNAPQGAGTFYYIQTVFYNTKATNAARAQFAFPYNKRGSMYHRYYASGSWSSWARYMNSDEVYPVNSIYLSESGTSPASLFGGTWTRITNAYLYATATDSQLGTTNKSLTVDNGAGNVAHRYIAVWLRTA